MNHSKKLALGIGLAAVLGTSAAQAAVKYVGTRDGVGATSTSEFNIAVQDGGVLDDGPAGDGEVLWSAAHTYVLQDIVFVTNGTLRIAPGSIVRGQPQSGPVIYDPGALVIATTAKLIAVGSPGQPIVFTTAATANTQYGAVATGSAPIFWDLNPANQGLYSSGSHNSGRWGGLVLLGNAGTNVDRTTANIATDFVVRIAGEPGSGVPVPGAGLWVADSDDRATVEGIPATSHAFTNGLDRFGGHDNTHSSGELRYVSIKFGGAEIGANNELNGLTLGGVGSGTIIDRVEVFGNTDDGIEIFGGTVNLLRVAIFGAHDDQIDIDSGFQGKIQFALCVMSQDGDKMGEWDGSYEGESPNGFTAASHGSGAPGPVNVARASNDGYAIYNATFIGNLAATTTITNDTSSGGQATGNNDRNHGIQVRDQSSPSLYNSILVNPRGYGLAIGNRSPLNQNDVINRITSGASKFQAVTFAKNGATAASIAAWSLNSNTAGAQSVISNSIGSCRSNEVINADDVVVLNLPVAAGQEFLPPMLKLNPVAYGASATVVEGVGAPETGKFRGAFDPFEPSASLWTRGWSVASRLGIITDTGDEGF